MRVGVTGHRSQALAGADHGLLGTRLVRLFELLALGSAPGRCMLISALAEGADRIAAGVALALGWRLRCPLPFDPAEYEKDFASAESLKEFRGLLARAERVWTAGNGAAAGAVREAGYSAANQAILADSRLLLAIWDGRPARGQGGTGQVVAQALERGLAVVRVDSAPPHEARLYHTGPGQAPLDHAVLEREVNRPAGGREN